MIPGIERAFYAFTENREELENAILRSTKASFSGSSYSIELFPEGTYRISETGLIGNKYHSPGLIFVIPPLSEEEFDSDEEELSFFENAIEELEDKFYHFLEEGTKPARLLIEENPHTHPNFWIEAEGKRTEAFWLTDEDSDESMRALGLVPLEERFGERIANREAFPEPLYCEYLNLDKGQAR